MSSITDRASDRTTGLPARPAPRLVLGSLADLQRVDVSWLRSHARHGGRIELALPGLSSQELVRRQLEVNAAARDCGCETGGRVTTFAALVTLITHRVLSGALLPHAIGGFVVLVMVVLAAGLAGKGVGILQARYRLARVLGILLQRTETSAGAAPFPQHALPQRPQLRRAG